LGATWVPFVVLGATCGPHVARPPGVTEELSTGSETGLGRRVESCDSRNRVTMGLYRAATLDSAGKVTPVIGVARVINGIAD
jgi:hypothetical protein